MCPITILNFTKDNIYGQYMKLSEFIQKTKKSITVTEYNTHSIVCNNNMGLKRLVRAQSGSSKAHTCRCICIYIYYVRITDTLLRKWLNKAEA